MRQEQIKLIVYDFDGVMTNNTAIVMEDGTEGVIVNRGDGLGISMLKKAGILQIILSTEVNIVVEARARKLKLEAVHGCSDKKNKLLEYCADREIDLGDVLYVGNDINDLECIKIVGFSVAPADSHKKVLELVDLITTAKGGQGVIRELADFILS